MDIISREGLFSKAKSIISAVYGLMLWASNFPSPMQTTKELIFTHHNFPLFGLKAITCFGKTKDIIQMANGGDPQILHSYMILSPSLSSSSPSSSSFSLFQSSDIYRDSSSSSWSSSLTGDLLGTESGVHTITFNELIAKAWEIPEKYNGNHVIKRNQRNEVKKEKEEYPPPISSLARTGNLPCRMPWVLTRHYVDGKLVIKMKNVKHHEYYKADRRNDRFVLKLIPLDPSFPCCNQDNQDNEEFDRDLDFIEEESARDLVETDAGDDDGNEMDGGDHIDKDGDEGGVYGLLEKAMDGESQRNSLTSFACSVPKSCQRNGSDVRMCFTYAGTTIAELERFLHGTSIIEQEDQSGPSPISFGSIRPAIGVM